ncbi:MAG: tRNA pseudouridine(55) synthase TruB [Saprospiraceae bacterium]
MLIKDLETLRNADFQSGVTILVDKPLHWTSFDVVKKQFLFQKYTGIKKLKVGHSGALDPLATGLLMIAIGKDTKKLNDLQNLDKVYSGTLKLGASTVSYDAEFEPDMFYPTDHFNDELIEKTKLKFIGVISQRPPVYSALKIDGKKAYQKARQGEDFQMKERQVEIYNFDITEINIPDISFSVHCQKGTYIRSLAHDFGIALGSGSYLTSLVREKVGEFYLQDAFGLEELIKNFSKPEE